MGMDIMDLSFRLEKSFGTLITNDDWMDLVEEDGDCTVRDVYELLLRRRVQINAYRTSVTLNAEFWSEFQSGIAAVRGVPVDELQLQTRARDAFPIGSRFQDWRRLCEQTGYQLPALGLPYRVIGILWAALLVTVGLLIAWSPHAASVVASLAICLLLVFLVVRLLRPFRSRLPANLRTLKDLCRMVRDQNLGRLAYQPMVDMPSSDVWLELKRCMVEAIGVDDDEIMMDARLVADLGCD